MGKPSVTVICIAYNHGDWIEEALESVAMQDYYQKELIIVDNGSSDNTREKIKTWLQGFTGLFPIKTVFKDKEQAYCSLFNEVLFSTKTDYIVDLAGDDVLYPDHLSLSIKQLEMDRTAAFVFSDAYILDEKGNIKTFYKRNGFGELLEEVELGIIYQTLLQRSYICAATIVFNARLLKEEGGYDTSLFYEDFDIQLRLTRKYPVLFSDHIGILKRQHGRSMSAGQYQSHHSNMLPSTVLVCQKAHKMNLTSEENKALGERVMFELKHALWSANFSSASSLVELGEKIGIKKPLFGLYKLWAKMRWDISWIYESAT